MNPDGNKRGALQLFNYNTKASFELPADIHVGVATSAYLACAVVFHNQVVLLGSLSANNKRNRQISTYNKHNQVFDELIRAKTTYF